MAERGVEPNIPKLQRRALDFVRFFTSPLLPDDYLELINPLWSTRELRGRIVSVDPQTEDASTVLIKPGYKWGGHKPGQYLRIGLDIEAVRHWRAYSLTSEPERPDGCISITVKHVDEGKVSPYLNRKARVGTIVSLGGVEGEFLLPDPLPDKLLFISAGSGITPIMSMLRSLDRRDSVGDVAHLHSAHHTDDVIFGDELRELASKHHGFALHEQHTEENGRMTPADLDELCPDWQERVTYISGPSEMLDDLIEHWDAHGDREKLHMERFQPKLTEGEPGEGGKVRFIRTGKEATSDGTQPILVAGEEAGVDLDYGCREGICHTCVGTLRDGKVRDLRTGEVHGEPGEDVRICIHAPEGDVDIEL